MNHAVSSWRPSWRGLVFAAVLACLSITSLHLYTRHNTFPFTYHVDEERKVHQITQEYRNCWHPLLLLTATDATMRLFSVERLPQNAVVAGRWCSAGFAVLTVLAFALLAWAGSGRLAGAFALLFVASHPQLYEAAHFMKEDTGLLMGIALSLLGVHWMERTPGVRAGLFLGAANGLAVSGKYAGAVMILLSMPFLFARRTRNRGLLQILAAYGGSLIVVAGIVNLAAFGSTGGIPQGVGREWDFMISGHDGARRGIPHAVYFWTFLRLVSPPLILLALFEAVRNVRARRWLHLTPVAFAAGYMILLSVFPKTADRYLLPVVAVTCYFAALGAADLAGRVAKRMNWSTEVLRKPLGAVVVLAAALSLQGWTLLECRAEFANDSRAELARWIATNIPAGSQIASGIWVQIPAVDGRSVPHPQSAISDISRYPDYAADHGTVEILRERGIEYVAVARPEYYAFMEGDYRPASGAESDFRRRSKFYRNLQALGTLAWESPEGIVKNLHPGIQLFRLPPPPGT